MRAPRWLWPSPAVRYAIVVMFALSLALSAGSYLAGIGYYHREQAAQQRQGAQLEQKLCATLAPLGSLSSLEAPAGNPAANPSRAFEQRLVRKLQPLAQLGPDIGCGRR